MNSQKLAAAIIEKKRKIEALIDSNVPEVETVHDDLIDAKDLLKVLAHIVEGMPINKAFGSPGDWGHETAIGAAIASRV